MAFVLYQSVSLTTSQNAQAEQTELPLITGSEPNSESPFTGSVNSELKVTSQSFLNLSATTDEKIQ